MPENYYSKFSKEQLELMLLRGEITRRELVQALTGDDEIEDENTVAKALVDEIIEETEAD